MEKSDTETTATTLKWVHIAVSNAKRTLLGIYHKVKGKYLQLYLDEFCYKLNRNYFGNRLFDRIILALLNLIGKKGGESNEKPLRLIIFILTHKVGITSTSTK